LALRGEIGFDSLQIIAALLLFLLQTLRLGRSVLGWGLSES
jgi:hypothetical protein